VTDIRIKITRPPSIRQCVYLRHSVQPRFWRWHIANWKHDD